jgi:hypothetical protein
MTDKFCIIIDDEPQDEVVENLKDDARQIGIQLHCYQLNPQEEGFQKNAGTEDAPHFVIDIEKITAALRTPDYRRVKVDIIACDYHLEDDVVNGYEIIRKLRNHLHYRKAIILYSGNLETVIREILREENLREKIDRIKALARANIFEFNDKNDYRQSIITALRRNEFSLEFELELLLQKYSEWTFKSVYPAFSGRTISEILDEIEAGSAQGQEFQKALLANAVAHMINLNRDINE